MPDTTRDDYTELKTSGMQRPNDKLGARVGGQRECVGNFDRLHRNLSTVWHASWGPKCNPQPNTQYFIPCWWTHREDMNSAMKSTYGPSYEGHMIIGNETNRPDQGNLSPADYLKFWEDAVDSYPNATLLFGGFSEEDYYKTSNEYGRPDWFSQYWDDHAYQRELLKLMEAHPRTAEFKERIGLCDFHWYDYWPEIPHPRTGQPRNIADLKTAMNSMGKIYTEYKIFKNVSITEIGAHPAWNKSDTIIIGQDGKPEPDYWHRDGGEAPGSRRLRKWLWQALVEEGKYAIKKYIDLIMVHKLSEPTDKQTWAELIRGQDRENGDPRFAKSPNGNAFQAF